MGFNGVKVTGAPRLLDDLNCMVSDPLHASLELVTGFQVLKQGSGFLCHVPPKEVVLEGSNVLFCFLFPALGRTPGPPPVVAIKHAPHHH